MCIPSASPVYARGIPWVSSGYSLFSTFPAPYPALCIVLRAPSHADTHKGQQKGHSAVLVIPILAIIKGKEYVLDQVQRELLTVDGDQAVSSNKPVQVQAPSATAKEHTVWC